jgi:hypothetical protein
MTPSRQLDETAEREVLGGVPRRFEFSPRGGRGDT